MLSVFTTVSAALSAPESPWGAARLRNAGRWLARGLLLAVLVAALAVDRGHAGQQATISAETLNLRPEPGLEKPPLAQLRKGQQVRVLEVLDGWLRVRTPAHEGYIRNRPRYVRLDEPDPSPAAGSAASSFGASDYRREAERLEDRLAATRRRMKAIDRRETDVLEQLDAVDRRLNASRQKAARLRRRGTALAAEVEATARTLAALQRRIAARERQAGRRLAAMYKLSRLGGIKPLISAPTLADLFRRRYTLSCILEQDRRLLDRLAADRGRFEALQAEQEARRLETERLAGELRQRMAEAQVERRNRSRILADIRSRRKLELAAIESMKAAARALDEKFRAVRPRGSAGTTDASPLEAMAGLLKLPISGKVIHAFGPYRNPRFDAMNFRSGIDIRADRGEPVQAVCAGRVIFADWFKGYGNMVIIDHGGGDYSVYAHMEELFKKPGDAVETGEVIATVGETGSSEGPMLYFEIRHAGQPEDPLDWVRSG